MLPSSDATQPVSYVALRSSRCSPALAAVQVRVLARARRWRVARAAVPGVHELTEPTHRHQVLVEPEAAHGRRVGLVGRAAVRSRDWPSVASAVVRPVVRSARTSRLVQQLSPQEPQLLIPGPSGWQLGGTGPESPASFEPQPGPPPLEAPPEAAPLEPRSEPGPASLAIDEVAPLLEAPPWLDVAPPGEEAPSPGPGSGPTRPPHPKARARATSTARRLVTVFHPRRAPWKRSALEEQRPRRGDRAEAGAVSHLRSFRAREASAAPIEHATQASRRLPSRGPKQESAPGLRPLRSSSRRSRRSGALARSRTTRAQPDSAQQAPAVAAPTGSAPGAPPPSPRPPMWRAPSAPPGARRRGRLLHPPLRARGLPAHRRRQRHRLRVRRRRHALVLRRRREAVPLEHGPHPGRERQARADRARDRAAELPLAARRARPLRRRHAPQPRGRVQPDDQLRVLRPRQRLERRAAARLQPEPRPLPRVDRLDSRRCARRLRVALRGPVAALFAAQYLYVGAHDRTPAACSPQDAAIAKPERVAATSTAPAALSLPSLAGGFVYDSRDDEIFPHARHAPRAGRARRAGLPRRSRRPLRRGRRHPARLRPARRAARARGAAGRATSRSATSPSTISSRPGPSTRRRCPADRPASAACPWGATSGPSRSSATSSSARCSCEFTVLRQKFTLGNDAFFDTGRVWSDYSFHSPLDGTRSRPEVRRGRGPLRPVGAGGDAPDRGGVLAGRRLGEPDAARRDLRQRQHHVLSCERSRRVG